MRVARRAPVSPGQLSMFDLATPEARPAPVIVLPPAVPVPKPPPRLALKRVLDDYRIEHLVAEGATEERLYRFGYVEKKLLAFFGAEKDIETIERNDGRAYTAAETAKGNRPATASRDLCFLLAACNHAKKEGRTKHDFKIWRPKGSPPRVEWVTEEQQAAVMALEKPRRLQLFLHIGFNTGARSSAIEQLTWDRVDLAARTIDFRLPGVDHKNKRRAVVPIKKALYDVLVEAKAWRDANEPDVPEVIGRGPRGKPSTTYHKISELWVAVGCKFRAPRHVLRHTFVTRLLRARVEIVRVAMLVGDTVAMIERVYGHLIPGDMASDVEHA